MNSKIIQSTKEFWQKRSSSTITDEDARTIIENLSGFFEVLSRWEESQRLGPKRCTKNVEKSKALKKNKD